MKTQESLKIALIWVFTNKILKPQGCFIKSVFSGEWFCPGHRFVLFVFKLYQIQCNEEGQEMT